MLIIESLMKSYPSQGKQAPVSVLDIPAFRMAECEQTALVGPSGSGKSTLLNLIAGIVRPTGGSILFRGHPLEKMSEAQLDRFRASHIGYVFQSYNLLPGFSALENVLVAMRFGKGIPPKDRKRRARELLDQVGLGHRLEHKPSQLSNGEQQRVSIARALANGPGLVLADEPTASLDVGNAEQVFQLLTDTCRANGAALLLCSHDLSLAGRLQRMVNIRDLSVPSTREVLRA
jgi:ABC-type lipoprotein export system ATPase subunit